MSGTGHYEANFNWDASKEIGAYLDFGDKLEESMKVWIKGQRVGGQVSTNPTKDKKDVSGVDMHCAAWKPTVRSGGERAGPPVYVAVDPGVALDLFLVQQEERIKRARAMALLFSEAFRLVRGTA